MNDDELLELARKTLKALDVANADDASIADHMAADYAEHELAQVVHPKRIIALIEANRVLRAALDRAIDRADDCVVFVPLDEERELLKETK